MPLPVPGRPTFLTFWARNALFHGLGVLGLQPGDVVLVPAFHCETLVGPILEYGCRVVFYRVDRQGAVDLDDVSRRVDGRVKAMLAIHYFGVYQRLHDLVAFCAQHGMWLIEDCAHLLCGTHDGHIVGGVGDLSIFSWRKFLPIYDGGLLVCNRTPHTASVKVGRLSAWHQLKIVKHLVERSVTDTQRTRTAPVFYQQPQRNEPVSPAEHGSRALSTASSAKVSAFDAAQLSWPMSRWSRAIAGQVDVSEVATQRRARSHALADGLRNVSQVRAWSSVEADGLCAWAFPIVCEHRSDVHVRLRARGIEAFSWGGVVHPSLPLDEFPDAKFLYDHLVLLPNHQDLTPEALRLMVNGVAESV